MKDRDVVSLLLSKEVDISGKIHYVVGEILRLGYNTDRGRENVHDLVESIKYSLDEMEILLKKTEKD